MIFLLQQREFRAGCLNALVVRAVDEADAWQVALDQDRELERASSWNPATATCARIGESGDSGTILTTEGDVADFSMQPRKPAKPEKDHGLYCRCRSCE